MDVDQSAGPFFDEGRRTGAACSRRGRHSRRPYCPWAASSAESSACLSACSSRVIAWMGMPSAAGTLEASCLGAVGDHPDDFARKPSSVAASIRAAMLDPRPEMRTATRFFSW